MENKKTYREQEQRFRGQKCIGKNNKCMPIKSGYEHTAKIYRGNTREVKPNSAIHEEETKTMM